MIYVLFSNFRDSYLRFSSQLFNLTNYHESVHLTNNAIQSKYKNHNQRDKALPDENMWDCHTFKTYLRYVCRIFEYVCRKLF